MFDFDNIHEKKTVLEYIIIPIYRHNCIHENKR